MASTLDVETLRREIKALKWELAKVIIGAMVALTAIFSAIVKLT